VVDVVDERQDIENTTIQRQSIAGRIEAGSQVGDNLTIHADTTSAHQQFSATPARYTRGGKRPVDAHPRHHRQKAARVSTA
jgi:hypothetical protein